MDFEFLNFEKFIMQQRILECCPDLLYTVEGEYSLILSVKNVGKHNLYNFRICQTKLTGEKSPYKVLEKRKQELRSVTEKETFYDKSVLPVGVCYSYDIVIYTWKYNNDDIVISEFEVECQDAFGTMYTQKLTVTVTLDGDGFGKEYHNLDIKCDKPTVKQKENAHEKNGI